jgi:hypothetical protein
VAAQVSSLKLARIGLIALAFTFGCVRFGYDPKRVPQGPDTPHKDAGPTAGSDAAGADAGERQDASDMDASRRDAAAADAAMDAAEGGGHDAAMLDASGPGTDGSMPATDAGPTDDGAMSDAAASDGQVLDAGDPCAGHSGALFCDSFDDPTFMPWAYEKVAAGSTAEQSTSFVHTPAGALVATTGPSGSTNFARLGAKPFPHIKSGDLWLRAYYFIPNATVTNSFYSTVVIAEIEPPYFGFSLVVFPTQVQIGVGGTMYPGTMAFPHERWVCVELHVQIDASQGHFEGYFDGLLAVQSPALDTMGDYGYTSIDVGIHYTDTNQNPVLLYVDDVVAGTTRPGCN